jgi:hypothetical protein
MVTDNSEDYLDPCTYSFCLDLFVIEWNGLRIAVRDTCSKSG